MRDKILITTIHSEISAKERRRMPREEEAEKEREKREERR
jgi:hypothetical protein